MGLLSYCYRVANLFVSICVRMKWVGLCVSLGLSGCMDMTTNRLAWFVMPILLGINMFKKNLWYIARNVETLNLAKKFWEILESFIRFREISKSFKSSRRKCRISQMGVFTSKLPHFTINDVVLIIGVSAILALFGENISFNLGKSYTLRPWIGVSFFYFSPSVNKSPDSLYYKWQ